MPTLSEIPFYSQYQESKRQNEQRPLVELQQASGLMGLMSAMEKAKREQQFRGALGARGPNATQEQLAGVAAKYGSPADVLKTQQSSLDRQATIAATRETARSRIDVAIQAAND